MNLTSEYLGKLPLANISSECHCIKYQSTVFMSALQMGYKQNRTHLSDEMRGAMMDIHEFKQWLEIYDFKQWW